MQSCSYPFTLLDTQHRMHAEIARFPSARFYHGRLRNAHSTLDRQPPWTRYAPILIITSPDLGFSKIQNP